MPQLNEINRLHINQVTYGRRLRWYELLLGINLLKSKQVEPEKIAQITELSRQYFQWAVDKKYVDASSMETLRHVTDNPIVLAHTEHQKFVIATVKHRIEFIKQHVVIDAADNNQIQTLMLAMESSQNKFESNTFPPANQVRVLGLNGRGIRDVLTFSVDADYPMSMEAAVAEEVLHLLCHISKLSALPESSPEKLDAIEELAVKYYVVQALKDCGHIDAISSLLQWDSEIMGLIKVWINFVHDVGEVTAQNLFYYGQASSQIWNVLIGHVIVGLRSGGIK